MQHWLLGLIICVGLIAIVFLYLYYSFVYSPINSLKQDPHVDRRVTSVITHGPQKGTATIQIYGLGSRYAHIGYGFRYDINGIRKNISTIENPINVLGKNDIAFPIYLGTCDHTSCTPDTRITNEWVLLEYTNLLGKKILTGTP